MIKPTQPNIHQLKITLAHITPSVWRRVQVSEEVSLHRLATILICAMGWHGGHMHQFRVGEELYGLPDEEFGDELGIIDEQGVSLKDVLDQGVKKFIFEYDFGDGWEHVVEVEKTMAPGQKTEYPRCIDGARRCPPEDCGGPHGYDEFLKAIRDPKHPEHESMLEWGGAFDPEAFDFEDLSDLGESAAGMEGLWNEYF